MKSVPSQILGVAILLGAFATGSAEVLLTHAGGSISETIVVPGVVLSTTVMRDATSSDTLYFRYTVDPNSGGLAGENSYAGLNLYNGGTNTLTWNIHSVQRNGCERYRFNGHVASLIATPDGGQWNIRVQSDGEFTLKIKTRNTENTFAVKAGDNAFSIPK